MTQKLLRRTILFAALGGIVACAPAPLYTRKLPAGAVTQGEIPRDAHGEPVWEAIAAPPRMPSSHHSPTGMPAEATPPAAHVTPGY